MLSALMLELELSSSAPGGREGRPGWGDWVNLSLLGGWQEPPVPCSRKVWVPLLPSDRDVWLQAAQFWTLFLSFFFLFSSKLSNIGSEGS